MKILMRLLFFTGLVMLFDFSAINNVLSNDQLPDHEKAIKAVNEGEILPLDEILVKINQKYAGRVISISLKDSEKGLFGWVYDIMIIEPGNLVKQLRVDAGTSTILSVVTGGKQ
tara:strand:+ start:386 stop:727 length:342 start_codon:yes stop_codon:yes gene_type:complete